MSIKLHRIGMIFPVSGLLVMSVNAGVIFDQVKLYASDAEAADVFGRSVDIDEDLLIVGAPGSDVNGNNSGCAYVIDTRTMNELVKLVPIDGGEGDRFGTAVALNGDRALVGTEFYEDLEYGEYFGAAYVFDSSTGDQLHQFTPLDPRSGLHFGSSVAIDGNTAVIGAWGGGNVVNGYTTGCAYVFDVETGQQRFKLVPEDGNGFNWFARGKISLNEKYICIGSILDYQSVVGSGSVYVYCTSTGDQLLKIIPPDEGTSGFGESISISGDTALIGAYVSNRQVSQAGAAFVYDLNTGQLIMELDPGEREQNAHFGTEVALDDGIAIIGSWGAAGGGAAYLFEINTGIMLEKIQGAVDGDDRYGFKVAISGSTAVVSAFSDDEIADGAGAVYLYEIESDPGQCYGDLNRDAKVDTADLGLMIGVFGSSESGSDLNQDGQVDAADLGILISVFGTTCL